MGIDHHILHPLLLLRCLLHHLGAQRPQRLTVLLVQLASALHVPQGLQLNHQLPRDVLTAAQALELPLLGKQQQLAPPCVSELLPPADARPRQTDLLKRGSDPGPVPL